MPLPFPKSHKWGYVDESGIFCIPPQYDSAGTFNDGRAVVAHNGAKGVIDTANKVVVPFEYSDITDFVDGFAMGKRKNGSSWVVVDENGTLLASCEWGWNLGSGMFAMLRSDGYVVTDAKGAAASDSCYEDVLGFVGGDRQMLHCRRNSFFCIEKLQWAVDGHSVVQKFDFDLMYGFCNGRSIVCKNNREGVVDLEGNVVVPIVFDEVQRIDDTIERFVLVKKSGADGFCFFEIDTGRVLDFVVEDAFCVSSCGESLYWILQNGMWSVLDSDFHVRVQHVGDFAEQMTETAVLVGRFGSWKYYISSGLALRCVPS